MLERLNAIEQRYNEITTTLMEPETISNVKKTLELTKEQSSLKDAYEAYQEYKKILTGIEESKELVNDPELGEMAKEELKELEENIRMKR